ncbi:MAG: hypothetical protein AB7D16_00850 [Eubacteriaceae bacterium]|jgi:ElaB/YqjD/DUF883 family membrane-anchored ribosome-binding protein
MYLSMIQELLADLETLIESGNTLPFSSKSLIDPEEAIDLIEEIRERLPEELSEAKKIVSERKRILLAAQNEADRIKKEAEKRYRELLDNNAMTKSATGYANEIMRNANNSAKALKVGTQNYADKLLYNVQLQLREINEEIEQNRREIKNMK